MDSVFITGVRPLYLQSGFWWRLVSHTSGHNTDRGWPLPALESPSSPLILYNDEENEIEKIKITKISPIHFKRKSIFLKVFISLGRSKQILHLFFFEFVTINNQSQSINFQVLISVANFFLWNFNKEKKIVIGKSFVLFWYFFYFNIYNYECVLIYWN